MNEIYVKNNKYLDGTEIIWIYIYTYTNYVVLFNMNNNYRLL